MRHKLAVAFVIASTACTVGIGYPADETQAATFTLNNVTSRDAATVLRSIVGVKTLKLVDESTFTVHGTQEQLDQTTAVVKMLDATDDTMDTAPLSASDGTVIAAVVLNRASSREVIATLRGELRIARVAIVDDKRVFLRDTDSQVQAALKVIERLEH